jgi:chemotaxis protein methyltransferase CheR
VRVSDQAADWRMKPTAAPLQILLVVQDRSLGQTLSGLLAAAGHQVECLLGPPSLAKLRSLAPELLLMEVPGPGSAEWELLRRLELQRTSPRPAVIVTAPDPALAFELLDVFDLLPQPLDEGRMLEDVALLAARRGEVPVYARIDEADLVLFQKFLANCTGLHFDRRNALRLQHGLQRRMRAVRASSYRDYLNYLEQYGENRQEMKVLLGLLTVGETCFFRYQAHFQALLEAVLPELVERNRERRSLRIWSAGCSTGEEPYSIALLLAEHFPQLSDWQVEILATDVNKRALSSARTGIYGARALRATAPLFRKKYFHAVAGGFELDRAIRSRVRFAYLNLQPGPYPALGEDRFDLVFCRNVMIYFQPETTRRIVARLAGILRPGGYLFLGHAETLQPFSREFSRVQFGGGFYYRRQDPPPTARSPEPEPLPALLPSPPPVAQSAAASPPQPSARLAEFPSALGDPPERGTQYWSHLEAAAELAVADSREYLVIRLGGERFGLEITVVREILRAQKWVRVPAVPEHVLGVFNRRGQIVAVTDLRGALGLPTDGVTPGGRLVVVEGQGMVTALWAEQVEGIRSIPRTAVEPPTPGRVRCHFGGIAGQVQLEDGLLVLLDLPSLLSHPGLVVDQSKD